MLPARGAPNFALFQLSNCGIDDAAEMVNSSGQSHGETTLNGASAPNLRLPSVEKTAYAHLGFAMLLNSSLRRPGDSLIAESRQISALGVLAHYPVPVIAVADDGAVLFANTAFAHLLGCSCDAVTSISYEDICSVLPADETFLPVTRLGPSLMPLGQATFFVKMRRSAIPGAADSDAVAMFEELMKRLWR